MVDKITSNSVQNLLYNTASQQLNGLKTNSSRPGVEISGEMENLIKKVASNEQNDIDAVKQARELLLSGQLETPENIQQAAENMLDFGI